MINDISNMATALPTTNGSAQNGEQESSFTMKTGLARMLKGGVIMDVVNAEQVGRLYLPLHSRKNHTVYR